MGRIESFFSMFEVKFALASVSMIIILAVTSFLLVLLVSSFKRRRNAIEVKLPNIDEEKGLTVKPQFEEGKKIIVELVDPSEDETQEHKGPENNEVFIETLTMETREYIANEDGEVEMPDVGEINYDKIREEKVKELESARKKREKEAIDHLREVAKADSKEDLTSLEKLNTTND